MKLGWRIWLLLVCLVISLIALRPSFEQSIVITGIDTSSPYYTEGLRTGMTLVSLEGKPLVTLGDYQQILSSLTFTERQRIDITTDAGSFIVYTNHTPDFSVGEKPHTRLKLGLDLRGGARALVKPEMALTEKQMEDLIAVSQNRFNVYGLTDVSLKSVTDLEGNRFMLIEIAGATPGDLEELIGQQGKFEAKIANRTVFTGGSEDIGNVCRKDATCSGIRQCDPVQGGYGCQFIFTLYLTPGAAQRHADVTKNVSLDTTGRYLSEKLILSIDGEEVDSLLVGADLRGRVTTDISIQGPGTGTTEEQAIADARAQMNKLQTILITGSLPYKLEIVKLDTIAPVLGDSFGQTLLLAGFASIVLVSLIVFVRYRAFKASVAILVTSFSEIVIILGVAALIGWNLDLPSIAGILATIGTGVDQQIVILDEARKRVMTLSERMKRALFIVMSAYMTALVSLVPLYWAGAGLFKGFALTTIIGISAGVFISRPAFAALIEQLEEKA